MDQMFNAHLIKVKRDQSLVYNKPLEKGNLYFVTKLEIRR